MPPRDLPGDVSQKKLIHSLERLGYVKKKKGGKGSHTKMEWPENCKCFTVQKNVHKGILRAIIIEVEEISGHTWEDLKKNL